MREREFIISFPYGSLRSKGGLSRLEKAFQELGYSPIPNEDPNKRFFEKGKKIATYLGLINWNLIYRKVLVELIDNEAKVLIHYYFSWFTNIGVLVSASGPELKALQSKLGLKSIKVERYR